RRGHGRLQRSSAASPRWSTSSRRFVEDRQEDADVRRAQRIWVAAIAAAFWVAPASGRAANSSPTPAPVQASTTPRGDAEKGKALFSKNACFQCHNNEAQGGAAGRSEEHTSELQSRF